MHAYVVDLMVDLVVDVGSGTVMNDGLLLSVDVCALDSIRDLVLYWNQVRILDDFVDMDLIAAEMLRN